MVVHVGASGVESVVNRVDYDPFLPLRGEFGGHVGAQLVDGRHEARVDVGLHRVDVGREEDAGTAPTHLVDVVHDLRVPFVLGPGPCVASRFW